MTNKVIRGFAISYRFICDRFNDFNFFNNNISKEFIADIYPQKCNISEAIESASLTSYLELLFVTDNRCNFAP